jgi:DNA-binding IclR family transcriptional regulator
MKLNTVDKALKAIELLSENPRGLRLSELSVILDVPQSSLHHTLSTLMPYDYVQQDRETKKYSLGFRFLEMSKRILDNMDLRTIARRHLDELYNQSRESTHLSILRNKKLVFIEKIGSPEGLSLATYIGFATDPHAAAAGKVLLADLSEEELRDMYLNVEFKSYAKNTIRDLNRLLNELGKVRAQGYAIDDEEYYEGVRCIAAPVRAGGKALAAVSITGSIFSFTREKVERELKQLVVGAADKISKELRW